jgi:hypothetical protein
MPLYLLKSMQSFGFRPQTSIVLLIRYHPHEVISLQLILCFYTHTHDTPQALLLLCFRSKIYLSLCREAIFAVKNLTWHCTGMSCPRLARCLPTSWSCLDSACLRSIDDDRAFFFLFFWFLINEHSQCHCRGNRIHLKTPRGDYRPN